MSASESTMLLSDSVCQLDEEDRRREDRTKEVSNRKSQVQRNNLKNFFYWKKLTNLIHSNSTNLAWRNNSLVSARQLLNFYVLTESF